MSGVKDERRKTKDESQNPAFVFRLSSFVSYWRPLAYLLILALAVRLLAWHWRGAYQLGGDESEYLEQARTLLIQHRYAELQLMRPPLYTLFLAGAIVLFDSLAQNLRLAQAFLSTATLVPMWLLTGEIFNRGELKTQNSKLKTQIIACLLTALSYTLAANATELLSETLFLFGLTTTFWLLVRTGRLASEGRRNALRWAALTGIVLGLLCLTRSVALPLLPLGALWLGVSSQSAVGSQQSAGASQSAVGSQQSAVVGSQQSAGDEKSTTNQRSKLKTQHSKLKTRYHSSLIAFVLCSFLVILPWTARNYLTYGALIVIDTTGAENLWLDNNPDASTRSDPLGREDAKEQLYALGDDRAARQRLASTRGVAAITAHPAWFLAKARGELLKFFALEYSDDMRARPAIWVPPAEVWMRLILGDGLWLVLLLTGVYGLTRDLAATHISRLASFSKPHWLFIPWLLYVLFTAMLFHVELRYRLPLYPILIPYTALVVSRLSLRLPIANRRLSTVLCLLPSACCLLLTLLHAPYPTLAWTLGWKHYHLARAERALTARDAPTAQARADAALALDNESALARVALARAALLRGALPEALVSLNQAIAFKPDSPYAHILRGDMLRSEGADQEARRELAYERNKGLLEDIQTWTAERIISPPLSHLDVGHGRDLGFIHGFFLAEQGGWRWSEAQASLQLKNPTIGDVLRLRLASGRPAGAPLPSVTVLIDDQSIGTIEVKSDWQTYTLPLPASASTSAGLTIVLRADTFTPRTYNRATPDGRTLGVMVDWAEVGR